MPKQIDYWRYRLALGKLGLTQKVVAERMAVRPSTLSSWVTGGATPPAGWLRRLEDAVGVPAGFLEEKKEERSRG